MFRHTTKRMFSTVQSQLCKTDKCKVSSERLILDKQQFEFEKQVYQDRKDSEENSWSHQNRKSTSYRYIGAGTCLLLTFGLDNKYNSGPNSVIWYPVLGVVFAFSIIP